MRKLVFALLLCGISAAPVATARARGQQPEDVLKGRLIISDQRLPMRWSSVGAYVSQLKSMNKGTLWYDKKTGKLKLEYAAFFAQPPNDVQVNLVIRDITPGVADRRAPTTTEVFSERGQRAVFGSVTLDKEDFEMNRRYRLTILDRGKVLATGEVIVRGEGPHYSGRVEFTDDEAKQKD